MLKKIQKDVGTAISTYEDRQRAEARSKVEVFARELDYSLAELFGTEVKAILAPAPAKHRQPENTTLIWFGRGRKPQRFVDALISGKTAGNLAIA